jgi:endonuclease YncB( thermonuclease family)
MAFSLHPAGPEDVRAITTIFQEAFKTNPIMSYMHPRTPKEVKDAADLEFFHDSLVEGDKYGGRYTKVVDNDTG